MINKKIFYWACDRSENSGEGKLALFFLDELKKKYIIKQIVKPKFKSKNLSKIFNHKYVLPFLGIYYCWKFFLNGKKVYYVNYLPFWNFLIFLLLPPEISIGPITGGAKFYKNSSFTRRFFFPLFYKMSEVIVNYRNFTLLFSTDLLKNFLSKKTLKKSDFNFIIKKFTYKKRRFKKTLDFLIYYRDHENKKKFFPFKLIDNLILNGYKVNIVGDYLKIPKVKNHGFLKNKKLLKLQKKAKFTIFSRENLYSIFILECIVNNVIVVIEKSSKNKLTFFKDKFVKINFKDSKELHKLKNVYKNYR